MEIERNRRRDQGDNYRRRPHSAANIDRRSASHRQRPAGSRPVPNDRRSSASRYERTAPSNRERSGLGQYEQRRTNSRLPEENREAVSASNHARSTRKVQKKAKTPVLPMLLFIVGLVVLGVLVWTLMSLIFDGSNAEHNETKEGVAYLESLEAKNPAAIDETLAAIRKKRTEVERDVILQKLLSDENDVWSMFHDYVILGDSRAVGFYYYDFLERSRVLAEGGNTIRNIAEHIEEIKALNPSYIFLCYGLNDVSIGFWNSPEEYTEEFMEICANLKQEVPGARIIISSILPARDPAFETSELWREIPTYSDALQVACEENDIVFVDNSQTCEDHADLWDIDGIHVRREFYSYWARNLIVAVIEDETYE